LLPIPHYLPFAPPFVANAIIYNTFLRARHLGCIAACTNQAESYFAHVRRAEFGTHHHTAAQWRAISLRCYAGDGERQIEPLCAILAALIPEEKGRPERSGLIQFGFRAAT
jgi:hypothetical protein